MTKTATPLPVSLALDEPHLAHLLHSLEAMDIDALRGVWTERFGPPPLVRAADLMRRALAEKLQEQAYGLDKAVQRRINQMAARHKPGHKPKPAGPAYKRGAVLTKTWQGQTYRVEVVDKGFVWNGQTHASLSVIARQITGVRWNGPRFFGLRDKV
jgi:hypothetical protein